MSSPQQQQQTTPPPSTQEENHDPSSSSTSSTSSPKKTTVYVSNLADSLSEEQLKQFLSFLGTIVHMELMEIPPHMAMMMLPGRRRVYRVEFSTEEEAKSAIDVNETVLIGQPISISYQNPATISPSTITHATTTTTTQAPTTTTTTHFQPLLQHYQQAQASIAQQQQQIPHGGAPPNTLNNTTTTTTTIPIATTSAGLLPPPPTPLSHHYPHTLVPPQPFGGHHPHHPHHHHPHHMTHGRHMMTHPHAHHHMPHHPHHHHPSPSTPPPPSLHFIPNPYIKSIPGLPMTPLIASTGHKEKDQEIARTIYVGNINSKVTPADLVDFFSVCGPVGFVRMAGDESQPTRFAFIEFLDMESAQCAMMMNGRILMERPIKINRSKNTIVKPPIKLTREEQKSLDSAVDRLSRKLHHYMEDRKERARSQTKTKTAATTATTRRRSSSISSDEDGEQRPSKRATTSPPRE